MLYLYDNSTDTFSPLYRTAYENLDEHIDPQVIEDTSLSELVFFASLTDIFTIAKRRSAIRGRFTKDADGSPLIERIVLTDDERDWYDDILPRGAVEVFKKLSAFSKDIPHAYKYGITFGAKSASGSIESVVDKIVTDSSLSLIPSALIGHKFVITSDGELKDQQRTIVDNAANAIALDEAWEQDITGLTFNVYTPSDDYVMYKVKRDQNWDANMLQACDNAILEALISFALKEWYLINRYGDDYAIEEDKYQKQLTEIKSSLNKGKTPYRRPADFFVV
jgi:hypothetical protein